MRSSRLSSAAVAAAVLAVGAALPARAPAQTAAVPRRPRRAPNWFQPDARPQVGARQAERYRRQGLHTAIVNGFPILQQRPARAR